MRSANAMKDPFMSLSDMKGSFMAGRNPKLNVVQPLAVW